MSEIDVYGQHLTSWFEAHDNYSRGMLAFVEGTTEKSRLLDALEAQKSDLK